MFRALTCPFSGGKIVFPQHQSALNQCTVRTFTENEGTRCCVNTIFAPEDGHVNVPKHVEDNSVTNILLMNKENCALKLVDEIIL